MAFIKDEYFGAEFIDVDEWREDPVPHRYMHGGFEGTETRFSLYLPSVDTYQRRFLQFLPGAIGGIEHAQQGISGLVLASDCGAYLVESNEGHTGTGVTGVDVDDSVTSWRASAAVARLSKKLATEMYGHAPDYGYVFGGSGGGIRSLNCLEQTNVWNGAVSFVISRPNDNFRLFSLALNSLRILRPVLQQIADAVEVGGSGAPFASLTLEQKNALLQLYKAGYPREIILENILNANNILSLFIMLKPDPDYLDDFWSKSGYPGADHPDNFSDSLVDMETTIAAVHPPKLQIHDNSENMLRFSTVTVLSGKETGRKFNIADSVESGVIESPELLRLEELAPGDRIRISNRDYLALCHYGLYQTKPDGADAHLLTLDGWPIYSQRASRNLPFSLPYTYDINGKKAILIQNMCDTTAWPRFAAEYYENTKATMGGSIDNHLRLYFLENADHGIVKSPRLLDFKGYVRQAVRDLIDWVEHGEEPASSSRFDLTVDNAVTLPPDAATRCGLQPVVQMRANGDVRTQVTPGDTVLLEADVELPSGAGTLTAIEWDPLGDGTFPVHDDQADGTQTKTHAQINWSYDAPGTYFPAVRATAHRRGTTNKALYQLPNLGRTRVVVH